MKYKDACKLSLGNTIKHKKDGTIIKVRSILVWKKKKDGCNLVLIYGGHGKYGELSNREVDLI